MKATIDHGARPKLSAWQRVAIKKLYLRHLGRWLLMLGVMLGFNYIIGAAGLRSALPLYFWFFLSVVISAMFSTSEGYLRGFRDGRAHPTDSA